MDNENLIFMEQEIQGLKKQVEMLSLENYKLQQRIEKIEKKLAPPKESSKNPWESAGQL